MSFKPPQCPNPDCSAELPKFIKKGFFYNRQLNQHIRKFQCKTCGKICSSRTFKLDYKHKKIHLNFKLAKLLCEGASIRAASRILGLTYYNTYLKFLWLKKVVDLKRGELKLTARSLQIDELETIHHTKCKPLSIALAVSDSYQLIAAQVAEMPAKGRLAEFSRMKYGPRKDERDQVMQRTLNEAKSRLENQPQLIESDQKSNYRKLVQQAFTGVELKQHKRPEKKKLQERMHEKLRKKKFDPLFAVNHKCALLRSHIKRLTRRSWCTTKKVENLQLHLDLFVMMQLELKF